MRLKVLTFLQIVIPLLHKSLISKIMKKIRLLTLVAFLLVAGIMCNSCYGPFKLTSKLYSWNGTVGNNWANSAVLFAFMIIPVYEVTLCLDALLFNAIEFWGGSNPISMEEGEKEIQIVKSGNKEFKITATKNKFQIEQLKGPQAGETAEIIFAPEEYSCYLNYQGEYTKLVEYLPAENGVDRVNLYMPDGSMLAMDAGVRDYNAIRNVLQAGMHNLAYQDQD
jgi:hypothetical protein